MKTSQVLKKARKLIKRAKYWEDIVLEPYYPIIGLEDHAIGAAAVEAVVGTYYPFDVQNMKEFEVIRDVDYRTYDYTNTEALKVINKLIKLALERGM